MDDEPKYASHFFGIDGVSAEEGAQALSKAMRASHEKIEDESEIRLMSDLKEKIIQMLASIADDKLTFIYQVVLDEYNMAKVLEFDIHAGDELVYRDGLYVAIDEARMDAGGLYRVAVLHVDSKEKKEISVHEIEQMTGRWRTDLL